MKSAANICYGGGGRQSTFYFGSVYQCGGGVNCNLCEIIEEKKFEWKIIYWTRKTK